MLENSSSVKSNKHPSQSSPSINKKRPKRTATPETENSIPRSSKRIRLQYQPFQSPPPPTIIPPILRHSPKTAEDKIIVFNKGEFLAVRNENGTFFVCRTAQNVYKSSRRFKIQWLNNDDTDIYTPDFYDYTDFECVLTNLRMRRADKNKYHLPNDEWKRTMNILQRALNVENGMDIPDPHQVTMDGVDVSIVGNEEEEALLQQQQHQQQYQQNQQQQPQNNLKSESGSRSSRLRGRGRPKKGGLGVKKQKGSASKVKLESRELAKVKLRTKQGIKQKEPGGRQMESSKRICKSEKLTPNPKVKIFEKDPTFQSNLPIPFISTLAHSKLLIRAIIMKDFNLFKSLLENTEEVCSLSVPRSVDVPYTALTYAIINDDLRVIKALLNAKVRKYAPVPDNLLEHMDTGEYNQAMLGFSIRSISISRGGQEGNNAFLKDTYVCDSQNPYLDESLIKLALRRGVSIETIRFFEKDMKDTVLRLIPEAVKNGHHKLAGQLVKEAVDFGGYGYSEIHQQVLLNDKQELPKIRPKSVIKKALNNPRITPLHCAAINPNPKYLATLLSLYPFYNLPDKSGWQTIHYAAACKTTATLELLLSRGVQPEDITDNDGNTPLHIACMVGRPQNVELLLVHSSTAYNKKDQENSLLFANEKFGFGGIDRPNKKTFCPLHLAAKKGHVNVVNVLLRYGADTEKTTSAAHDKLTPLMIASQWGHLDIVKNLVEKGSLIEMKDKKQRTALTHAIINGHAHIASYLLRLGADPNFRDSSGNTLLHYAAAYGWYFCLDLLLEAGASPNSYNDWKLTPLSVAYLKGHMGLVDCLLEQSGVNIDVAVDNDKGLTLLMQTVKSKICPSMLERVKFLVIKQKSDCSVTDYFGNNVLHHFVMREAEEIRTLKEDSIKEDNISKSTFTEANCSEEISESSTEEKGKELFREEEKIEHDKIVKAIANLLINQGCDPKAINKEGESPFSLAAQKGCLLLIEIFVNAGCELMIDVRPSLKNNFLHSLVEHACQREVKPILDLIMKNANNVETSVQKTLSQMVKMYNQDGYTPLLLAVSYLQSIDYKGSERLIALIQFFVKELKCSISTPIKNSKGEDVATVLHLAAKCNYAKVFDILLLHNPPLDAFDSDKQTPLIVAIKNQNVATAEKLIKAGCNVNIRSEKDDNSSPIILASRNSQLDKVIPLLLQHKADPNDIDLKNGNTPLHYVVSRRNLEVLDTVKALTAAGASVNTVNNEKQTPLHLAVNSHMDGADVFYTVEDFLLNSGSKTDVCDVYGRIPLHYAFIDINNPECTHQIDPIELVALLTNAMGSVPLEIVDNYGQTPLHRAAFRGATISCMHLASKMKNIDIRDKEGNTPLGLAVMNSHESCTLMLLQKGCSCTADLIKNIKSSPDKKTENKHYWIWHYLKKEIPPPLRCSILQEAVQKDLQGIVFLMLDQLESINKGYSIAIEAALKTRKYNLALKLIPRVKHSWTLYNEKQSTLHILARQPESKLQTKVAQALIDKGVPLMAKDEHGCSVMIYSALKWNSSLISFIYDKVGTLASVQADPDKSLRTPLSALFWQLGEKSLPQPIKTWFLKMIKEGANPNILTRYPIQQSSYPGVRFIASDELHEENPYAPCISPLMVAIYKQNIEVARLLLKTGADVNFCNDQQQTPIMIATKLNDIKMVKLLLDNSYDPSKDKYPYSEASIIKMKKTSQVDLAHKDIMGRTVVHHIISPFSEFSYDNVSVLKLLAHVGAPLDLPDKEGNTPLQLALRNKAENAIEALQTLLKVPPENQEKLQIKFPSVRGIALDLGVSQWNYKEDSKALLRELQDEQMETTFLCQPDEHAETGEVLFDKDQDLPYDILMIKVDLNYGNYGLYNFYKMQLIHQKAKDLVILFTRWGRVGDSGQYQKTPFRITDEAIKEFCKIFKSKSGNTWENVKNFQHQPKKYDLVSLDKRSFVQRKEILVDIASNVPSKLSPCLNKLLKNLMDVHMIKRSLKDMGCLENSPFGTLSESSLIEAEKILQMASEVVTEKDNLENSLKTQDKYEELSAKILDLSEKFYRLVPLYGYSYEKMALLSTRNEIEHQMKVVHDLMHIEFSGELLLAAQYRSKEINPSDYVYRCLGCQLDLLDENGSEAQLILQYIHNSCGKIKPKVEAIFRVFREGESADAKDLPHHAMLWHGTKVSNLLGILKRGLQPAPLGVFHSGSAFGKGVYFADMFKKSRSYCWSNDCDSTYMLLCEVALGNTIKIDVGDDVPKEADSVKVVGSRQPSPPYSVCWQGCRWPVGPAVDDWEEDGRDRCPGGYLRYSEYVAFDPSRICLRYLVQLRD
ncbi:poly [ADP-ribose] polymerase tankyrase-like isoform X2 [Centruroides vittatus]|uniref:poly [ADP-ribose] polymerase tankyrase-like isoform X2 n=1 Tax=Centruroides vittatus TaxID=120091 RepID=UPI003510C072